MNMNTNALYVGKRVVLVAMPDEGVEEEHGEIIAIHGDLLMVRVDEEHKLDDTDDCLRECDVLQVQGAIN